MNQFLLFGGGLLSSTVAIYTYKRFYYNTKLAQAHRQLNYLEATDRCMWDVKSFRKNLAQSDTNSETDANCELINKLYYNCLKTGKCSTD